MTPRPSTVIFTMRSLKREQVRTGWMDRDAIKFIMDNRLMAQHEWPGYSISITEAGAEYTAENGGQE